MKTLDFPLSKITLFFVCGILFAHLGQLSLQLSLGLLAVCFCVFGILHFFTVKHSITSPGFGIMVCITSFVVGISTFVLHSDYNQANNYIHLCNDPDTVHELTVRLDEKLKNSVYRQRYIASVRELDQKPVSGKVALNLERDSTGYELPIGAVLKISAKVFRHKPSKNPGQFDYGNYLAVKSIPAQVFVARSDVSVSDKKDKTIGYYAAELRNRIYENLKKHNFKTEELNIAMALLLGQQQEISKEVLQDYQFAGAVHILSVSGLHVGFILIFINFLLSGIPKSKYGNIFGFITSLTGLWLFAILAGLAPSVIRSAAMFSFLAFGIFLKRDTNIFHNLLVSMLCILAFKPSFLFDVGFQLSYISLFFILWLQPLLHKLWSPKNKAAIYVWKLLTVSFAAQMGAFPLSVYYFHQFPGLFFITNLVVLPGLGIIMGLGVFVMLLAAFDYVPGFPMLLLEKSITVLNWIIKCIASFEQFIYQDLPLNLSTMLFLYGCMISVFLWCEKPGFTRAVAALAGIILLQINAGLVKWDSDTNTEMLVFHMRNTTVIAQKASSKVVFYTSGNKVMPFAENTVIKSYLMEAGAIADSFAQLRNTFFFNEKKILLVDSLGIYPNGISPDIILLSDSPKINLDRIVKINRPKVIVADGSNYKSYVARWAQSCKKQKIPFHATYEKGFYKVE